MKAELKTNSVNQIIKGTDIYVRDDKVSSIGLLVKGRVCIHADGVKVVVGSGTFLGLADLPSEKYNVTYTAETNSVVYAFPAMRLNQAVRGLITAKSDYGPIMVSSMSKYIRSLSKVFGELEEKVDTGYDFIKQGYQKYQDMANKTGIRIAPIPSIENMQEFEHGDVVDLSKVLYYKTTCDIPNDVQKAYYGYNSTITIYHVMDQVSLIRLMISECKSDADYLVKILGCLVTDAKSLYKGISNLALSMKRMGEDTKNVINLFDDVVNWINTIENLLVEQADIELNIDHENMEEVYFKLLSSDSSVSSGGMAGDGDDASASIEELDDTLGQILEYAELDVEKEDSFREYIDKFIELPDKSSTDDDVRKLRQGILKLYYEIYQKVFLKDYNSDETPIAIDLFLRYGLLSEKLVTEQMLEELLSLDRSHSGMGVCKVYDMKEWLTEVLEGRKEPSKSEFDLDYDATLREKKKTGEITEQQMKKLSLDKDAKFDFEVKNLFKTNHRLIFGQPSTFVPFLHTNGCIGSLQRGFMSVDKVNAVIHRLLQIDFSAFYRESLYVSENERMKNEHTMEEVFPDIILFPTNGSRGVMWQELSGRRRNTPARFLLPVFMDSDIDVEMIRMIGRFRWELCRTMQGASWNNIQLKSLTSEYSDFIQFYRKNRDLSDEKKDKLKMQIQKARNSTREVFVVDYENWIKHESNGGMVLNKPVREIMAVYCPFSKEIRQKLNEQPLFRDAMARFVRERGKKKKEYDLKFRVWEKDKIKIPEEVIRTRDFYVDL